MARQITNIHLGIVNWKAQIQFTYEDGKVENFLFDVPLAKQLQDGIGQVIEAIDAQGPQDGMHIRDQAVVRLIDGGQTNVEKG